MRCRFAGIAHQANVAFHEQALVLGAEVAEFLFDGREVVVSGESLVPLFLKGLFPGTEQSLSDAQGAGGLSHGVVFLRDQFDRLDLELACVVASLSR